MVDLLDLGLALKVLASNKLGNVVLVAILALIALLHALVALGQLAQGGQGVGAELVENTGDELRQLLVLAGAVDGEGVCGDGSVYCVVGAMSALAETCLACKGHASLSPTRIAVFFFFLLS